MLLGLILTQKNYTLNLAETFCVQCGLELKEKIKENFNFLLMNVPNSYEDRNKDAFAEIFKEFLEKLNGISLI